MIRGDLSDCLIHLTKGDGAEANFENIIKSQSLRGGNGDIRGGYNCVCFSEAPISILAQMLAKPSMRYAPLGVMVKKQWLFQRGGRPVLYQPETEFEVLPDSIRYRHVRYEPENKIDFTWEREWRVKCETLPLDPTEVTLVVPSRSWEEKFMDIHAGTLRGLLLFDNDLANAIQRYPWHFIVLQDLGVEVTWPL